MDYKQMIRALGTEQEAADKLKVARSTVWRLLRGSAPSYKTMEALKKLQVEALRRRKRS